MDTSKKQVANEHCRH